MIDKTYLQNHAEHRAEYEDEMRRYELISESGYYTSPAQLSGITYGIGKISSRTEKEVMHKVDSLAYIEKLKQLIEKEEAAIDFSNMDKCELVISGSGEGGVPRFTEEDYKQSSEYVVGQEIKKSDYEKFNQRFLIHIVPIIGNIKMND